MYNTKKEIQKGMEFLNQIPKPECNGCMKGVAMCHNVPCIGTVEDIEKILDAGLGNNLMLDYWTGNPDIDEDSSNIFRKDVFYLAPATQGSQGKKAPFIRGGICAYLIDNKCSLHSKGLKPTQGRSACCKIDNLYIDSNGEKRDIDERLPILMTWNTKKGKDLIERWIKEVNYSEDFTNDLKEKTSTMFGMLESLMQVMEIKSKTYEVFQKFEDLQPKEIADRPVIENIYPKPY
jgi:hypothetical protein